MCVICHCLLIKGLPDNDLERTIFLACGHSFHKCCIEGFMEVLIRLSILKALPTPEEIEEAGQDDAYGYLQALEEEDAEAFFLFVLERATPWGAAPSLPHPDVRIEQLIGIIVAIIEVESGNRRTVGNVIIEEAELHRWFRAIGDQAMD